MLDVSVSYNKYKFIGHEFLTWLWFVMEEEPDTAAGITPEAPSLQVGNRVVLERRIGADATETVTIQGDDAGLEEALLSLRKGALVTEMNLVLSVGEWRWQYTLKGESFHLTQVKLPETGPVETPEDVEGAVLERMGLFEKVVDILDRLFSHFVRLRISESWSSEMLPRMQKWTLG